ncbi:MAG: hypothetical protein J6K89_08220 [Oscillospiraceae bacterium]|nr:hypothetical protein [Oscillospiraceae bacterium]
MKQQKLTQVLDQLDPTYIEEAGAFVPSEKKQRRLIWYLSAAACLLLLLSCTLWIGLGSLSPSEPHEWEILLEHSKPTFTEEGDPTSEPTLPSTAPLEPSNQGSEPISSEEPTSSEPIREPTSPEPTDHTEPTEPPTTGNTEPDIPPEPNGTGDPDFTDFLTEDPIEPMELPKLPTAGGENYILKQISFRELYTLQAAEGDIYPIFADPYPMGQEGPLFPITEDYLAMAQGNLQHFLTLLLGQGAYRGAYEPNVSHELRYEGEGLSLTAGHSSVNVTSGLYVLPPTVTPEELDSNPLIRAALSYCGIEAPVVSEEIEYDIHGAPYAYVYTLTEQTEDPFTAVVHDHYTYVSIRSYAEGEQELLSVTAVHSQAPVEVGVTSLATVEEIEAYLQEAYPHLYERDHVIELFYSSAVMVGYTVPCYLVIFENPEMSQKYAAPAYTVVQLTDARFLS